MVQKSEALNKHYYDLFMKTIKANIPEYDKCDKRFITPLGTVEPILAFDPMDRTAVSPAKVGQRGDYIHFRGNQSVDKADPEVEGVVRLLAERETETLHN